MTRPVCCAQDTYASRTTFHNEDIRIGGCADEAWIVEPGQELLDLESRGDLRPRVDWSLDKAGAVVDRFRAIRARQVVERDTVSDAGSV
jgi:hypothetical protein